MDDLERLTQLVYQARWVDAIKNADMATDKAIAQKIIDGGFSL